jgi:hypothetical protein
VRGVAKRQAGGVRSSSLTSWSRPLLEKSVVAQLVNKPHAFMELENLVLFPQRSQRSARMVPQVRPRPRSSSSYVSTLYVRSS